MKKALSFMMIFLIITLVYQIIIIFLESSHEVTYKLLANEKEFEIIEKYQKQDQEDGYFLNISVDNNEYIYYVENNYNKQKRIIKDIIYYEKDDYLCIYPVTSDKKEFEIQCSDGNEMYSYDYVNKKVDISDFLTKLGIEDLYYNDDTTTKEHESIYFYTNNFYGNEHLSLYRYKKLNVYNKGEIKEYNFSNKDIYKNELGVYIDNYFLVPIYENSQPAAKYLLVDSKKFESEVIYFDDPLSSNLYNIGVLDNKLYVFDLTYKKEYEINTDGKYKVIGTIEKGFTMYEDGKWVDKSITDFTQNKIKFEEKSNIKLNYSYDQVFETSKYYYILDNHKLYKIYKKDKEKRILLFELPNDYNNLQIDEERIYYIHNQYLYRYDMYGVKTLVNNNEFKYNNTNIYHMYNNN